jgi:oligosaccharyltransferase complex subunit beta
LAPKLILDFIGKGGNVLLALSGKSPTPSAIINLLLELDINLPPDRSSVVVDHFNYDTASATEYHDVLLIPRPAPLRRDVRSFFSGDGILAVPRAVAQSLGTASPLIAPILRAPETAYSIAVKDDAYSGVEDFFVTGTQLALVSALQARNSARFAVLGSAEILQDKWFSASVKMPNDRKQSTTANREFSKQLSAWTFQEIGVLKAVKIEHYLSDMDGAPVGDMNPKAYRIKNDVVRVDLFSPCYTITMDILTSDLGDL